MSGLCVGFRVRVSGLGFSWGLRPIWWGLSTKIAYVLVACLRASVEKP